MKYIPSKTFVLLIILLINGCDENKNLIPPADKTFLGKNNIVADKFYFVVNEKNKIGIYKYNFIKKKSSIFWSDKTEKVILLSYSPNLKHIYFLTAKYFGIRSTLTYIKRIKLYKINPINEEVIFVDSLINGTQINADWTGNNSFKVIINLRDLKISEYMNKHTLFYNNSGKKLLGEIETINLIKNGYPLPVINKEIKTNYKNFKFQINQDNIDSLYLFDKKEQKSFFIYKLNRMKFSKVFWRDDFLIITISGKTKEKDLLIYSLEKKLVVKVIEGKNIKNFLVFGNYLVYDSGLSFSSSISIFNLEKLELTDSIKFASGCGLRKAL